MKFHLRSRLHALRRRFGMAHFVIDKKDPVHFLVDWSNIACRKSDVDTGKVQASRTPSEVTCIKCMKAKPHEFNPVDRAYAKAVGAGVHKRRDAAVEWIHAAGGPEAVLRMSPLKIREASTAYLGSSR